MTNQIDLATRPRMKREIIIRLGRLLNMRYKPSELANEIGVSVDTIYRTYMKAGAPFERDKAGQVWIVGTSFREWAITQCGNKHSHLEDNQAWCLKCNKPVIIIEPRIKVINRYLEMVQGKCSECGTKVNRGRAKE